VTWADITPTILDYCEVEPKPAPAVRPGENVGRVATAGQARPYTFHGRSFLKKLQAPAQADASGEIYLSHTFHEITNYYPMRTVRSGKYKLIFNIAHQLPFPFASDLYGSPTWQQVVKRNTPSEPYGPRTVDAYVNRPRFELFDLEADPNEARNLADDPNHRQTLESLQEKLRQWQTKTQDPWDLKWTYE
jgi:N-sulfoglucosamine sulfohydrolase